ncbi:L-rhamnose mutarotase [Actinorugispora endophytica]|uniref:L-rhamnose mutarotase n=1 Tax=Actinorugispora endophytica TaxID=1605990 RepID=A0A4V3D762_9ACTN|nr:L-rhamnose mutarotase [Actinorugispora endophytica]TDQ46577.1 L-rhamnose mutarotase [Actinorugispora endophytica]
MTEARRYGHVVRLRPEHREEYLRLHREVWPEVREMIRSCNIRDYTIYLHGDLLFSHYVHVGEDHAADMDRMAADPRTRDWWRLTDPCQERLPGTPEGEQWLRLPEVWHLS